ncbi:MAG: GNAT family N-acetyltransferase, partial [Candidatus Dormibacteraeota bacterium]|nr:GNAT family N-acetyltransferase [Candidatus Dormibacteraeota bacterium]
MPLPDSLVEVAELSEVDELKQLEALFTDIWERSYPAVSSDLMQALRLNGNYIAGAFSRGELVAGIVGFLGITDEHGLHLHSHILGVRPALQVRGVGYALKQHQRTWALDRGIRTITWTFDPLVRRNAYFNLAKLGADIAGYHRNLYGTMADGINGAGDSDRLLVAWNLESQRAVKAAAGVVDEPLVEDLVRDGAVVALLDDQGRPVTSMGVDGTLICQVPEDIVALRAQQPELAHAWR